MSVPEPMDPDDRDTFARHLREQLNSRRDVFVVDKFMFEPQKGSAALESRRVAHSTRVTSSSAYPVEPDRDIVKTVSAATLKLLLDYCENDWNMDFVSYCAGIFQGRAPEPGETAFDLLPDVKSRLSADRLGFGHIYGGS